MHRVASLCIKVAEAVVNTELLSRVLAARSAADMAVASELGITVDRARRRAGRGGDDGLAVAAAMSGCIVGAARCLRIESVFVCATT